MTHRRFDTDDNLITDFDRIFPRNTAASSKHAMPADFCTACQPNGAADQRVITDFAVVPDLHQIVDFYAVTDDRRINGAAIDGRASTDGHIRANTQATDLGNRLKPAFFIWRKTKAVCAQHSAGMHGTALTQAHVGIYDHIGENFRFRADGRVMPYHTVCLHHGTCLDAHIGSYHHMSPNVGVCSDISRWVHHRA